MRESAMRPEELILAATVEDSTTKLIQVLEQVDSSLEAVEEYMREHEEFSLAFMSEVISLSIACALGKSRTDQAREITSRFIGMKVAFDDE